MKVFKRGEQFFMEDNGVEVEIFTNKTGEWLKLPENSVNRDWCKVAKVLEAADNVVDYGTEIKVSKSVSKSESKSGSRPQSQSYNPRDFLFGDDRKLWDELLAKAEINHADPLICKRLEIQRLEEECARSEAERKAEKAE